MKQAWILFIRHLPQEETADEVAGILFEAPIPENVKESMLTSYFRIGCVIEVTRDNDDEEFFVVTVITDAVGDKDGTEYVVSADKINI